jgi:hypothetical protein
VLSRCNKEKPMSVEFLQISFALPLPSKGAASRHSRIVYGWRVVLTSAIGLFWGVPVSVYSFTVFLKPLMQQFHASRAGSGAMIMLLLTQRLIAKFGWREAYALLGGAVLLVALPTVAAFLEEKPEDIGFVPDGRLQRDSTLTSEGSDQGMGAARALRTGTFIAFLAATLLSSVLITQLGPYRYRTPRRQGPDERILRVRAEHSLGNRSQTYLTPEPSG